MDTILDFIFLTITYSGGVLVVMLVTLLSIISFYIHRHRSHIAPLLVAVGGSSLTTWVIKHLLDVPRPLGALYTESTPSFPSGHATASMALYGFLFWTIYRHHDVAKALPGKRKHPLQNKSLLFLGLLIALIGASRLYLGVHYLSDVLVGYTIGLLWIFLANAISKRGPLRDYGRRE